MKVINYDILGYSVTEYVPCNIFVIDNVMDDAFCDEMVKFIDDHQKIMKHAPFIHNKNNVECHIIQTDNFKECDNKIFQRITRLISTFKFFNTFPRVQRDVGYSLRKIYGKTHKHTDELMHVELDHGTYVRSCSLIIKLNDNYIGGTYRFPYHELSINPKKGSAILFPPYWTHPHEVTGVGEGQFRYTISTWGLQKLELDNGY